MTTHTSWQPVSEARASEFRSLRFGMFICWSFSTFSNVEWTRGVKSVDFFNPRGCDVDGWCRAAVSAGMRYILFLTKHHDGFCLWDTATTERKVTSSPLGKDALALLRAACDAHGLRLALYFSEGEWDWPGPRQANGGGLNPEMKQAQLRELLTQYGPIEFIWFDHAVGDGGLNHEETTALVKSLQPDCLVGYNHGSASGDLRLGEMGRASPLSDTTGAGPFNQDEAASYDRYVAAEFTYPILGGREEGRWFYTMPEWDDRAVSAQTIYADYRDAETHNSIFSLDVAPDRHGAIRVVDRDRLAEVGALIRNSVA